MIQLLYGDCLELLPGALAGGVDLILADPPFGTTACKWDAVIDISGMWRMIEAIAQPTTPVLLFAQTPFDKVLGSSNLGALRYEWIWEKTAATGFLNSKKAPLKAHENILVFCKGVPFYSPQKTNGAKRKVATRKPVRNSVYTDLSTSSSYDSTERYPRSVLLFSKDKQKSALHPTQKPVALLQYLIETYTRPGGTVLDFCMGSGSTGEACAITGRKFIGIEKDPEHYATACERLGKYKWLRS